MEILLLFAFVSGLITISAPCIWPLLPIVLSANTSGGHKKPLGITLGLMSCFAFITLFISYFVSAIPFTMEYLRYFAVAVIIFLGLSLILPQFSRAFEAVVSRVSGKLNIKKELNKTGFTSGFITGIALGIVWTPCIGPILATIALVATQGINLNIILVTIAYTIGIGIPLFFFATAGNVLFTRTRFVGKYTGQIQQLFGIVMILMAILIATNYDNTLQLEILRRFPAYETFLFKFESNKTVIEELNKLKLQIY